MKSRGEAEKSEKKKNGISHQEINGPKETGPQNNECITLFRNHRRFIG
jgi:hypothetical protein